MLGIFFTVTYTYLLSPQYDYYSTTKNTLHVVYFWITKYNLVIVHFNYLWNVPAFSGQTALGRLARKNAKTPEVVKVNNYL
jgi:hypothetical protein